MSNTPVPSMEQNPLQKAFADYQRMEEVVRLSRVEGEVLRAQNAGLTAEAGMLREALERSEAERVRLSSIASTLLGRLLSINDVIAGAVKQSIQNGIEATRAVEPADKAEERQELEAAGEAAQDILQRVEPVLGTGGSGAGIGSQVPPAVDWGRDPHRGNIVTR